MINILQQQIENIFNILLTLLMYRFLYLVFFLLYLDTTFLSMPCKCFVVAFVVVVVVIRCFDMISDQRLP